jgi:hypothetical protein
MISQYVPEFPTMINASLARELRFAKSLHRDLPRPALNCLRRVVQRHNVSLIDGDIKWLNGGWYVTHAGLLRLAENRHCAGIHVRPVLKSSDPANSRWVFRAAVFKSRSCKGFVGYGDADPSNVSALVHGAEMRIAETRAVNRALRKAYGIGICSIEEIGATARPAGGMAEEKRPPQPANINSNGHARLRDRLCQLIRQHRLDAALVKSYAIEFCRVSTLKEAKREQVEAFVDHIAEWAAKDRDALLCQLNSHQPSKREAA